MGFCQELHAPRSRNRDDDAVDKGEMIAGKDDRAGFGYVLATDDVRTVEGSRDRAKNQSPEEVDAARAGDLVFVRLRHVCRSLRWRVAARHSVKITDGDIPYLTCVIDV